MFPLSLFYFESFCSWWIQPMVCQFLSLFKELALSFIDLSLLTLSLYFTYSCYNICYFLPSTKICSLVLFFFFINFMKFKDRLLIWNFLLSGVRYSSVWNSLLELLLLHPQFGNVFPFLICLKVFLFWFLYWPINCSVVWYLISMYLWIPIFFPHVTDF